MTPICLLILTHTIICRKILDFHQKAKSNSNAMHVQQEQESQRSRENAVEQ